MTTTITEDALLKRRRVRAVLAGGLVLGVGAAVTLAAWNDSEFATGAFASGHFDLRGSTDGTTFGDHSAAAAAATLGFTVNPTNLSPTDVVYAPFAVALDEGTTYNADVTLSLSSVTGDLDAVTYEVLRSEDFGCDGSTSGESLVPAGTPLDAELGDVGFTLARPSGTGTGTGTGPHTHLSPVNLCFKVTAGQISQGATGTAGWEFAAGSLP